MDFKSNWLGKSGRMALLLLLSVVAALLVSAWIGALLVDSLALGS